MLKPGDKVRMTKAFKQELKANHIEAKSRGIDIEVEDWENQHWVEFGDCIGYVRGYIYDLSIADDVRVAWQPSKLSYGYLQKSLELVP